jgi:hypothetical protein
MTRDLTLLVDLDIRGETPTLTRLPSPLGRWLGGGFHSCLHLITYRRSAEEETAWNLHPPLSTGPLMVLGSSPDY